MEFSRYTKAELERAIEEIEVKFFTGLLEAAKFSNIKAEKLSGLHRGTISIKRNKYNITSQKEQFDFDFFNVAIK